MAKAVKEYWQIEGIELPVYIYREKRPDNRISITRKGVNLRVPRLGAGILMDTNRKWAKNWLQHQIRRKPEVVAHFSTSKYISGYEIPTPFRKYVLELTRTQRSTSRGNLANGVISIHLNSQLSEPDSAETIRTLISRVIAKDQLDRVSERIHQINDQCFQQEITGIRIKNNSSNWGSCSQSGNINISTRTLLTPFAIQDYIFIHELAHRIEMNHSRRYWKIVEQALPSYKKHERWIKQHGHKYTI